MNLRPYVAPTLGAILLLGACSSAPEPTTSTTEQATEARPAPAVETAPPQQRTAQQRTPQSRTGDVAEQQPVDKGPVSAGEAGTDSDESSGSAGTQAGTQSTSAPEAVGTQSVATDESRSAELLTVSDSVEDGTAPVADVESEEQLPELTVADLRAMYQAMRLDIRADRMDQAGRRFLEIEPRLGFSKDDPRAEVAEDLRLLGGFLRAVHGMPEARQVR